MFSWFFVSVLFFVLFFLLLLFEMKRCPEHEKRD